jgi:lipopolysaccharide transport system ATP-binding protein
MSDAAISIEGMSKRYRLGQFDPLKDLRDVISGVLTAPFRRFRSKERRAQSHAKEGEFLWALKDVTCEINQGEVVGVIGRNGAGKTTLLKVLSRITSPTEGQASIRGRVGSLLEVGTGFHQDLTGRENVYLNGAILGMTRGEINRKFDEIVDFSGVERFIDTPMKRYSTGMNTRLAFAVAAHLETEVLLVDEVLAVGDYEFQRKCLGKMEEVGRQGRTVLLVSHNMASILNLCPRSIVLEGGQLTMDGPSGEVIESYISSGGSAEAQANWPDPESAPGGNLARLKSVRVLSEDGTSGSDLDIQKDILIEIEYWCVKEGAQIVTAFHLEDQMGTRVLASSAMPSANLADDHWWNQPHPVGLYKSVCRIPANFLNEGGYQLNVLLGNNVSSVEARLDQVVAFHLFETGGMRLERSGMVEIGGKWIGVVRPKLAWQTEQIEESNARDQSHLDASG